MMYSTLCSLMLAGSSLTVGQSFFSGGCGNNNNCNDEGYGKYGSYGSYGSYGTSINCSNGGGGCGSGPFGGGGPFGGFGGPFGQQFSAQNILPSQTFPYAATQCKPQEKLDKKMAEALKSYEEKLREFERMILEADRGMSPNQLKQMLEARDKQWADRLAESQAKILTSIQDAKAGAPVNLESEKLSLLSKQLSDLADSLNALQGRVEKNVVEKLEKSLIEKLEKSLAEKLAAAKKDDDHVAVLEKHFVTLVETLGKSSNNNDLKVGLQEIAKTIRDSKSNAPNLHAWSLPPNRGLIVVKLPGDTRLFLDGKEEYAPGKTIRTFISPTLELGKRYFYTLRAVLERDGKVVFDKTEVVYFEPGQEKHVDFNPYDPSAGPALPMPAITNKQ